MFWLQAIGIPYLALLALAAIGAGRGQKESFARIAINFGIDACILGIGVTSGIFVSAEVRAKIGSDATTYALVFIFIDFIVTGICIRFREWKKPSEVARARLSVFAGTLILIINTGVALNLR